MARVHADKQSKQKLTGQPGVKLGSPGQLRASRRTAWGGTPNPRMKASRIWRLSQKPVSFKAAGKKLTGLMPGEGFDIFQEFYVSDAPSDQGDGLTVYFGMRVTVEQSTSSERFAFLESQVHPLARPTHACDSRFHIRLPRRLSEVASTSCRDGLRAPDSVGLRAISQGCARAALRSLR
ncbi:hypothetical protein P3T21_001545 [Paraburkholderia sp. GAS334]